MQYATVYICTKLKSPITLNVLLIFLLFYLFRGLIRQFCFVKESKVVHFEPKQIEGFELVGCFSIVNNTIYD